MVAVSSLISRGWRFAVSTLGLGGGAQMAARNAAGNGMALMNWNWISPRAGSQEGGAHRPDRVALAALSRGSYCSEEGECCRC